LADVNLIVVDAAAAAVWTVVNVDDDFYMPNNGDVDVHLDNQSNAGVTMTAFEGRECIFRHAAQNQVIVCPTLEETVEGPFVKDRFNALRGKVKFRFAIPGAGVVRAYGRRRT